MNNNDIAPLLPIQIQQWLVNWYRHKRWHLTCKIKQNSWKWIFEIWKKNVGREQRNSFKMSPIRPIAFGEKADFHLSWEWKPDWFYCFKIYLPYYMYGGDSSDSDSSVLNSAYRMCSSLVPTEFLVFVRIGGNLHFDGLSIFSFFKCVSLIQSLYHIVSLF